MFAKAIVAFAIVAAVRAGAIAPAYNGYLGTASAYHLGAQAEHTVRGYGGLNTVSHQSKSVVSPHSHVTKSDTRYTNDAVYAHQGYAAPAIAHGYASHGYAAPALAHGYASPALAHHGYAAAPLAHHGYGAQVVSGHAAGYATAPAAYAHGYASPAVAHHGYAAAPLAHHHAYAAAPAAYAHGYAAKAVAAPAIASYSFSRTYPAGTLAYAY